MLHYCYCFPLENSSDDHGYDDDVDEDDEDDEDAANWKILFCLERKGNEPF